MQYITVGGRQYLKYWHSDDPIMPKQERPAMTPEDRAKSVLHFLDEYLDARERAREVDLYATRPDVRPDLRVQAEAARQFLGTALVALVTDVRKVDE